jgi:hypothetical protein
MEDSTKANGMLKYRLSPNRLLFSIWCSADAMVIQP